MRQSPQDRAQYYRQLRATVATVFRPELASATAVDAAALVDRILAEFIVEEEWADTVSNEYGAEFAVLLDQRAEDVSVTPEQFGELRRRATDLVGATSGSTDPAARRLCRDLVDVERRFLERVDELRRVTMAEEVEADASGSAIECSVTAGQLTSYLRHKFPASPELTVTAVEAVPGGRSKETILVSLLGTTDLPPSVIVRKDRPVGLLPTKAADEFEVLRAVYDHGRVPVPRPFFTDEVKNGLGDPDADGTLLVMERVAGGKAGEYFPDLAAPTEHRRALGDQLAAALGRLHSLPLDALGETTIDVVATVTPESVAAAVEGMAGRIGELSGPPIVAVPLARQWLLDHVADVAPADRLCLLWGDVGLHNMLVDGDRITALVDWEAATVGPPARELAAVWPAVTTLMEWGEFVDAYRAAGGRAEAVDPRGIAFYRVFFCLGACMTSRTGGHLFRTGAKRDLLTAHSGLDAHFRAQRNLVHALGDAQAGE